MPGNPGWDEIVIAHLLTSEKCLPNPYRTCRTMQLFWMGKLMFKESASNKKAFLNLQSSGFEHTLGEFPALSELCNNTIFG